MQAVKDATQKETAIDQQHRCETLICQHQTILRFCPVLPRQAHGGGFANFIVRPHIILGGKMPKTSLPDYQTINTDVTNSCSSCSNMCSVLAHHFVTNVVLRDKYVP